MSTNEIPVPCPFHVEAVRGDVGRRAVILDENRLAVAEAIPEDAALLAAAPALLGLVERLLPKSGPPDPEAVREAETLTRWLRRARIPCRCKGRRPNCAVCGGLGVVVGEETLR